MWKLRSVAALALSLGPIAAWIAACGGSVDSSSSSASTAESSSGAGASGGTASGSSSSSGGNGSVDAGNVTPPSPCNNTLKDGQETDVDCGGAVCKKCLDGKACIASTDCAGGACIANVCATPACSDGATNVDETDVDCGGQICARCTIGRHCKVGTDCISGTCSVTESCACPKGMTAAAKAGGNGAYCIDETEVTKFQYGQFLAANVDIQSQIAVCKPPSNTGFTPRGAWPPIEDIPGLPPGEGTAFNLSLPVHYVDWCDAHAYCKWAGKQLCGGVAGGSVAPAMANEADASAWYNACSAGGVSQWPHGNVFDNRCNGSYVQTDASTAGPLPTRSGFGANEDESIHAVHNGNISGSYTVIHFANCAGGVSGLYHMSGNVAEWEDSCDGQAADSLCRVRGGSFFAESDAGTLSCKGERTEKRVPPFPGGGETDPLRDIGFRCCLY